MSKPIRIPAISEFAPRANNVYNGTSYQLFPPKDPDRLNCYIEKDGDHVRIFKRPGKAVVTNLDANANSGQGLTVFNGVLFAVVNDPIGGTGSGGDALVLPPGQPNSATDGTAWTNSATGPWAARAGALLLPLNGLLYLIGGFSTPISAQDVWATGDGGTWYLQTGGIPFGNRIGYGGCSFNGAMYLAGGFVASGVTPTGVQNDVWTSTDGATWTQIVTAAPWAARTGHSLISTTAGIFLLGGANAAGSVLNDIWFSVDGTTWNQVATTGTVGGGTMWAPRSGMSTWYIGNTIIIGGGQGAVGGYNDVWSSTTAGISWSRQTAAAWAIGINNGGSCVYNNKLWVFGGTTNTFAVTAAIYNSSNNGGTWNFVGNIPMGANSGVSAAPFNNTMILLGGGNGSTFVNTTWFGTLNSSLTNIYPLPSPVQGDRYDFQAFSQNTQLLIKCRTALYVADQGGVQRVTSSSYPTVTVPGMVVLGDSVYVMDRTGLIFGSPNSNPYVWPAENRIPADYESDPGIAIAKSQSYLVALGTYTTQFFYDAGVSPGSALLPYLAASLKVGCWSASTVQTFEQTVVWVSQDKEGLRQVVKLNGVQTQVISTPAIDKLIAQGLSPNQYFSDFIVFQNHEFYLLTIGSSAQITLVYDLSTNEWFRWAFSPNAGWGNMFITAGSAANLSNAGQNSFFLDAGSGIVYSLGSLSTDSDGDFWFAIQTAKFDGGNNVNKFWGPLDVVGDIGTGLVNIQFTDDDYNTWSSARTVDMSQPRPILYGNGASRRRAILLTQQDSNPRALEYLEFANVEQGGDG